VHCWDVETMAGPSGVEPETPGSLPAHGKSLTDFSLSEGTCITGALPFQDPSRIWLSYGPTKKGEPRTANKNFFGITET